jgi:hypothetical protein
MQYLAGIPILVPNLKFSRKNVEKYSVPTTHKDTTRLQQFKVTIGYKGIAYKRKSVIREHFSWH